MKVLVCGGRDYTDKHRVYEMLDMLNDVSEIIQGGANGADTLAKEWAQERGIPTTTFPADWKRHGKSAGMIRNSQMLAQGKPDLVVAFPGGRGTTNMVAQANQQSIDILEIPA